MEKRISLIIIEDDVNERNALIRAFDEDIDHFWVIGETDSADEGLKLVLDKLPDAVILDLELHDGFGDGVNFLKKLHGERLYRKPFILITTNNLSKPTHDSCRSYGADYILTKSEKNYSTDLIKTLLLNLSDQILDGKYTDEGDISADYAHRDDRLKSYLIAEFGKLGISPKAKGYDYLLEAILMVYHKNTQRIFDQIGNNHHKSASSVERAMQNAISRAWTIGNSVEIYKVYKAKVLSERGTPTNTEFIHYYARFLETNFNN